MSVTRVQGGVHDNMLGRPCWYCLLAPGSSLQENQKEEITLHLLLESLRKPSKDPSKNGKILTPCSLDGGLMPPPPA